MMSILVGCALMFAFVLLGIMLIGTVIAPKAQGLEQKMSLLILFALIIVETVLFKIMFLGGFVL